MVSPSRPLVILWFLLMGVLLLLGWRGRDYFQPGAYIDDAQYTVLSESIVYGPTYGFINYPGTPEPTRYPPGYPLILSPITRLFPQNLDALKASSLIFTLAVATLIFWAWPLLSRSTSYRTGLAVAAFYAFSAPTVPQMGMIMSEPAFIFLFLLAIVLSERLARNEAEEYSRTATVIQACLLGFVLLLLTMTRTIGALVILVTVGYFGWRLLRGASQVRTTLAILIASMLITFAGVVALTPIEVKHILPIEYLEHLRKPVALGEAEAKKPLLQRIGESAYIYGAKQIRNQLLPGGSAKEEELAKAIGIPELPRILGMGITALCLFGAYLWARREGFNFLLVTSYLTLFALLPWPFRDPRYLMPLLPALALSFLLAGDAIVRWLLSRRSATDSPEFLRHRLRLRVALLFPILLALLGKSILNRDQSITHTGDLTERTRWIAQNLPAEAAIASEYSEMDYLYSRRRTVYFTEQDVATKEAFLAFARKRQLTHTLTAARLRWQSQFSPSLAEKALLLNRVLDELIATGEAQEVYRDDRYLIRVVALTPPPSGG